MVHDVVQSAISAACGAGIVWGGMKAEVKMMKEQINEHKLYGERLATIEAKLDFLINSFTIKN